MGKKRCRHAAILRIQRWYTWREDRPATGAEPTGVTNEELLRQKAPAAVMYCLSALEMFEDMARDQILAVVGEIARLGETGLDYADADPTYTLDALPGRRFSGLQLLCIMYVGFKYIEPTLDIGVNLSQPYQLALKMHND